MGSIPLTDVVCQSLKSNLMPTFDGLTVVERADSLDEPQI